MVQIQNVMSEVRKKNIKSLVYLLLFLGTIQSFGQIKLSDKAEIAVITIGPYQGEVWSAFGHSGILVSDPESNINWFYNYGLYDFDQENFILNFAQGLLKYKVGVMRYDRVVNFYKSQNRYVKEQYLNLSQEQKQEYFDFLQNNVKPENAEYIYNYVYDNCATRLRDNLQILFPGQVTFDTSYVVSGKTTRDLMDDYLDQQYWGKFGINLGLGMQIDQETPGLIYMFLPDYIFESFGKSSIRNDSTLLPLISRTAIVNTVKPEEVAKPLLTPQNVFIILFFVIGFITNRNFKTGKRTKWVDTFLFSLAGFVGLWVAFLWLGTEHLSKNNLNILWAIPFHLPIAFFISRPKFRRFMKSYFKIVAIWYCVLLVVWAILPQPLGMPLVPLVLAMVLRGFYISYDLRKGDT